MRTFLGIGIAVAVIAAGYWFLSIKTVGDVAKEEPATYGATLSYVEGSVEYQTGDGVWMRAESYTNLSEGDSVETLAGGRAIINLDDGSAIRLDSETTVTLESLNPNNIVIDNEGGEVYARVAKADRFFAVVLDDVWYEAVGTAYKTILNDKENGVEVYESSIKMSCSDQDDVMVEEGYKYYQKNDLDQEQEAVRLELGEEEMAADEFLVWNKEKDSEITDEKWFEDEEESDEEKIDEEDTEEEAGSGDLSISLWGSGETVQWSVEGYSAKGFKVVWSKNSSPTYPTRSGDKYQYLSSPDTSSTTLTAFEGEGTYYVRVCEYLGGKCGVYSNQITVEL
ncbi:FecR family protein [Patescibacteria group bacterium]|nr:FecR family protein [Patescibacteria group bacterium]MBU1906796.1 FecR family protein [Patescibacteria group bacterium]